MTIGAQRRVVAEIARAVTGVTAGPSKTVWSSISSRERLDESVDSASYKDALRMSCRAWTFVFTRSDVLGNPSAGLGPKNPPWYRPSRCT